MDWSLYSNFVSSEFACKHCGKDGVRPELVAMLQEIRTRLGQPMAISSGYRCTEHPVEANKDKPGEHNDGMAADIICQGGKALDVIHHALDLGVRRIGVHQKGGIMSGRFIHIGIGDLLEARYQKAIWTY